MTSIEKQTINLSDIRKLVLESIGKTMVSDSRLDAKDDKWNREACYEEAKNYKSRGEFLKHAEDAFSVARRSGWIEDYSWFNKKKPPGYWTKENCFNEALSYRSSKAFRDNSGGAYAISVRNGWIGDYTWFVSSVKPKGYWNRETCYNEAKKYYSRIEFHRECRTGYEVARTNGWLDDYSWFKERVVNEKNIYVVYCYKDEETNSIYVGLTNSLKRRHRQHKYGWFRKGERKYDIVYRFFQSIGKDVPDPFVLEKDLYANEAQIYEELYIEHFKIAKLNVLNLAKAGSLGGYSKWDKDSCYNEARKFKSKLEFRNNSSGAYRIASTNGWLDSYSWLDKVFGKWNRETCFDEAKKYVSRTDFQNGSKGAYKVAWKNGWIDDYTWLKRAEVHNKRWTRENCYEEAKKYNSRNGFRKGNGSAYGVAAKNGWLDDYTWFEKSKTAQKWTRETCYEEALKYKSRGEFSDHCDKAYDRARKNGWLDDYTWFEKSKTAQKWTRETCYEEAKKYNTKIDFRRNAEAAYNAACKKGWIDDYPWLIEGKKPNGYWTRERCFDEAIKYKTRSEFSRNSGKAYNTARINGWLDDYTWFIKSKGIWVRETCYNEAKKYKTKEEFRKNGRGAYYAAWKNGWIDDYFWFKRLKAK